MNQDRKLFSKQPWEPKTVASYYKIPIAVVRDAMKRAGTVSREIVYEVLRDWGYTQIKEQKLNSRQKKKLAEVLVAMKNDPELSRQNMEAGL